MEPLRVLELYSGIGGMHQALRGGSALSASPLIHALALVTARAPGRGGAAILGGGDRGRGGLGCPGNRAAGHLLPPLWAEAPCFPPPAVPRGRGQPLRRLRLRVPICEARLRNGRGEPPARCQAASPRAGRPEAWRLSPSLWGTSGGRGGRSASLAGDRWLFNEIK